MKFLVVIIFLFMPFYQDDYSIIHQFDKEFFLLGTLDDYMGRKKYPAVAGRVDFYRSKNMLFPSFIETLFSKDYEDDWQMKTNEKNGHLEIYSKSLAERINRFYEFKFANRGVAKDHFDSQLINPDSLSLSKEFIESNFDSVCTGYLKSNLFNSDSQRLSFIGGAFIRFGEKNDSSSYRMRLFNSASKAKTIVEVLKQLNCKNVSYEILNNIPTAHIIHFKPNKEVKKYIEDINLMIKGNG